jgi:hypothetical protein
MREHNKDRRMSENESVSTSKGMFWTGVVLSALPSLMLLMASAMALSHSAEAVKGFVGQYGYPESAMTGIGVACLVSTILYIIPHRGARRNPADRLPRRRSGNARARQRGRHVPVPGGLRRVDLGRIVLSRLAHPGFAAVEKVGNHDLRLYTWWVGGRYRSNGICHREAAG